MRKEQIARVFSRLMIEPESGCLLWTGPKDGSGYGYLTIGHRKHRVHRLMSELFVGPIPDGLELDHVKAWGCVNRHCASPAHLEAVTHAENLAPAGAGPYPKETTMDQLAKIGAALPKTVGANGLNLIAPDLLAEPEEIHYLIIAVDCGSVNTTYKVDDFGDPYTETIPSARIRAIEPVKGGDAKMAQRLMEQARGDRTGVSVLPMEFGVSDVTGG